jgi:hypothetical protein
MQRLGQQRMKQVCVRICVRAAWILLCVGLVMPFEAPEATAQDELKIFGFFQGVAFQNWQKLTQQGLRQTTINGVPTFQRFDSVNNTDRNVFTLQQVNLFLSKDFGSKFSAFVNLEFTDNYSSNLGWGSLSLQEAFVRYEGSEYFNIKAGLFLPQFNNLYEIYNRLPLLPYVFRPFIYETQFDAFISREDYLPSRALLQIYGYIPLGDLNIDYAGYIGNAENTYIFASNSIVRATGLGSNFQAPGLSTVSLKTGGARVGVRAGQLKAGVSATLDNDNQRRFNIAIQGTGITVPANNKTLAEGSNPGDVSRTRIGIDAQYTVGPLTIAGEALLVNYALSRAQQDSLAAWSKPVANPARAADLSVGGIGDNLNKRFFYGTLQYDFTENFYGYATASYLEDNFSTVFKNGVLGYGGGLGYRLIDQVVVKLQYQHISLNSERAVLDQDNIFAAISVAF